jgi:hypothetical protein
MKFVPGGPLSQHLDRFAGQPELCVRLMVKVARAVHALHLAGIIHRDLKPLNVLLGDNDEPLVADFGLARWLDDPASDLTFTHVPIGTRQYMSPEQTLGQRATYGVPCDVWAIGVTMYESMTGRRPFVESEKESDDLYEQIRSADLPQFPAGIPAELFAITQKCLAKKPEDRYRSAAAIADDLERWLAGEKIEAVLTAPPVTIKTNPRSRIRRRIALGSLILGLTAAIALVLLVPQREQPAEQKKTIAERLRAGETVTLIGNNGLPLHPTRPLPRCEGDIGKSRSGFASLSAATYSAVELCGEKLPLPVRLRGQFALEFLQKDGGCYAGIYVGGKESPAQNPCQSILQLLCTPYYQKAGDKEWNIRERAGFKLAVWDLQPPGHQHEFPTLEINSQIQREENEHLRWQTIEIVIKDELVSGSWNGQPLKPVVGPIGVQGSRNNLQAHMNAWTSQTLPGTRPVVQPPYMGSGIGVCAFNASAVYRDITLEPIQPSP